jgi:hypothetical protein
MLFGAYRNPQSKSEFVKNAVLRLPLRYALYFVQSYSASAQELFYSCKKELPCPIPTYSSSPPCARQSPKAARKARFSPSLLLKSPPKVWMPLFGVRAFSPAALTMSSGASSHPSAIKARTWHVSLRLQTGFPVDVPAVSINRMCGSSQQAIHFAAQAILAGDADLILAGGTEMMSHQPLGADYPESWHPDLPYDLVHQGISAEMMAEKWNLTRDEQDDFAYRSHEKAAVAMDAGYFEKQIIPLSLPNKQVFQTDEGVRRPADREKMRALKPVFKDDGTVTAGNASQISDGSAAHPARLRQCGGALQLDATCACRRPRRRRH